MFFARPFLAVGLMGLLAGAGFSSSDAKAQQIYRIMGPDGRVTFSDKPPLESSAKAKAAPVVMMSGAGTPTASLPFEVRQAATRYPVTLYTAPGCGPCGVGRAMLSGRGIPFAEKTVTTNEDIEALKRLGGGSLPFLTIGGQQIKGYSEVEWGQFLDAAGYPKTSQLPANYSQAAATPLVAAQEPQRAARPAAQPERTEARGPVAPPEPVENPTGIRF
jgi:glutaredoxin